MAEFVRLDPPPTQCGGYASGGCCHDLHFNPHVVMPEIKTALCGQDVNVWRMTTNRIRVNCKDCLELLHS